jgi:glycogen debranching enzyme
MSAHLCVAENELVEIPSPSAEPGLDSLSQLPHQVDKLTLIDGKPFLSTNLAGDILPPGGANVGFFHEDTRFLSHLELRVGGRPPLVLSSSTEKSFVSQIELTAGNITLRNLNVAENTVHIRRQQLLNAAKFFDRLTFLNYNLHPVDLSVEIFFDADFVDVFQVRGARRRVHGQYLQPVIRDHRLAFIYRGLDGVLRQTLIEMEPHPSHLRERNARWELTLMPLKHVQIEVTVTPLVDCRNGRVTTCSFTTGLKQRRHKFAEWERHSTQFKSNHRIFDVAMNTAISDFHALQMHDGDERIVTAGVPWFATIFGRDAIIAAYQALLVNPQLAIETLRVLARYQGKERNDWRDEEPGKILHEFRQGEMTRTREMPFGPYYGSLDATPLFLVLVSETYNWTADDGLVRQLLPAVYLALDWIDRYGDLDGDGFLEYSRRSPSGLVNQGWKDSWDANIHSDGTLAAPPIAPIEVQGYVYDAKYRMASLLRSFGDTSRAERLKKEAAELAKRLDMAYWMPERKFYAMALDAEKKPLRVVASNPGHLLFSRVLGRERARAVVSRMMRDDMFTGWGWRTLSGEEATFNPLSYHRGAVWPHDNALIAHGMALNEFRGPALQVLTGLFQAALYFRDYRLPELFCGVQRRDHDAPVHYPVSCSPQAWASGAWFLLLTSVLGIRPNAQRKVLNIVNPRLPEWLDHLHIRNLRIGNGRVGLDFTRHRDRTYCNVVDVEGEGLVVNVVFRK